jgi:glucosyl-3-phosphoglycerate synthase
VPAADPPTRTFAASDWTPEQLLEAKAGSGLSVGVVIPARDEEETVGDIVRGVRAAWVEDVPLADEVVVIDSDSTDATARVAADAGARVHAAAEIRPDLGPAYGKGEALWKSLFVTTADLLAFVDSDLVQWGPHFVPGLLGPLLTAPDIALVKAVYDRPLLDAEGHETESGGRVTELVARPLLALHRPGLAGVVQPLAGEWSVRRSVLERLSVPVGYGVEIAALVDTADLLGPEAVAQVDLGRRAHRHHRHDTLGPMAVQVIAAMAARTGLRPASRRSDEVSLRQFERGARGFVPNPRPVELMERPAALTVSGYRAAPGQVSA